jgi:hypothetical protein
MVDLYLIYKQYYQRWYRHKCNFDYAEMKDMSHDLVKNFYESRHDKNLTEKNRLIAIEIAKDLIAREKFLRTYSIFGNKLLRNLENNSFEVNVPYPVKRLWDSTQIHGEVYILNSETLKGCSKLGATTLDLDIRIRKYENRYGYSVNLFYSLEIISPFYFEKFISELIRDKRVLSKSNEHTNEWYYISSDELQHIIESNIGNFLKNSK